MKYTLNTFNKFTAVLEKLLKKKKNIIKKYKKIRKSRAISLKMLTYLITFQYHIRKEMHGRKIITSMLSLNFYNTFISID